MTVSDLWYTKQELSNFKKNYFQGAQQLVDIKGISNRSIQIIRNCYHDSTSVSLQQEQEENDDPLFLQEQVEQQQQNNKRNHQQHHQNKNMKKTCGGGDAKSFYCSSSVYQLIQSYQDATPSALVGLESQFIPTISFDRDTRRFAIYNAIQEIQTAATEGNHHHHSLRHDHHSPTLLSMDNWNDSDHDENYNNYDDNDDDHQWWSLSHHVSSCSKLSSSSSCKLSSLSSMSNHNVMAQQIRTASLKISRPARIFAMELAMAAAAAIGDDDDDDDEEICA